MAPINHAAWIQTLKANPFEVHEAPYSAPSSGEVTIKATVVAINPADVFMQDNGLFIIEKYPAIFGCDAAGIVEEVGPDVTSFAPGDRVFGVAAPKPGGVYKHAAFQEYPVLQTGSMAKVPSNLRDIDTVVLPLGLYTSMVCMFDPICLGLALPPAEASAPRPGAGKTVIVWGASSSVGACALQMAAAAGYEIFGVASERNHPLVKSMGASHVFDQSAPNIVDDMVAALRGKEIVGAVSTIVAQDTISSLVRILEGTDAAVKRVATIEAGGEKLSTEKTEVIPNFAAVNSPDSANIASHIWHEFLPAALLDGRIAPKPDARIVGHGLEAIQGAVDTLRAGVSAAKIVVTL